MGNAAAAPVPVPDPELANTEWVEEVTEDYDDGFLAQGGVEGNRVQQAGYGGTSYSPARKPPDVYTPSTGGPSLLGQAVSRNPLGSAPMTDASFALDTPDGLKMPPGSEFAYGTALPSDAHGYSGERNELGERHGDGVQLFSDGRRYSGQFESNTFHGSAIMEWPDGHRYTGQYENNHKSGDGFFLWPDGRFYDGQWSMGQRHGHGQYIAAESYVGDYFEGFRHGDGVLTWPDGKRYAGQFARGALHGSAMMSWQDGRRYLGQYSDNQKQGEGMFHWPDGRLYEGQWRRGMRHGESRYVDNNGEEHVGKWHKDRLVSSITATDHGVRDPFCVPPAELVSKKARSKGMETIAESPEPPGWSHLAPPDALHHDDVVVDVDQPERDERAAEAARQVAEKAEQDVRDGVVTVNGIDHEIMELHQLRSMNNEDLREHAHRLHGTFGHKSSPVPHHDHGLLGWVYEVQSRHLRPLLDSTIAELENDSKYLKRASHAVAVVAKEVVHDVAIVAVATEHVLQGVIGTDGSKERREWKREDAEDELQQEERAWQNQQATAQRESWEIDQSLGQYQPPPQQHEENYEAPNYAMEANKSHRRRERPARRNEQEVK